MPTTFKDLRIVVQGKVADWPLPDVKKWIEAGQGTYQKHLSNDTTHLVLDPATWRAQGNDVKAALQSDKIKIMSNAWLEDSLRKTAKQRESNYLWKKIDGAATFKPNQAMGKALAPGASNYQETMKKVQPLQNLGQVFHRSTEASMNHGIVARKLQHKQALEQVETDRKQREQEVVQRLLAGKKEQALLFAKGAKQAKKDIFSVNHHIYRDNGGIPLDIQLFRIDIKQNRNERIRMTIYESNGDLPTYALNAQFDAKGKPTSNDMIVTIGSNFPTTWRIFRKVFQEKTFIAWEERIAFAAYRDHKVKMNRRDTAEIQARLEKFGSAAVRAHWDKILQIEDFASAPFIYYPPKIELQGADLSIEEVRTAVASKMDAKGVFGQRVNADDLEDAIADYPFPEPGENLEDIRLSAEGGQAVLRKRVAANMANEQDASPAKRANPGL